MHRRVFAWSLLSVLMACGCADGYQDGSDNTGCGNGMIDSGEECDGAQWATGKDVCPNNLVGKPVCDPKTCKAVYDNYCFPQLSTCGNNLLDAGEDCDNINGSVQWVSGKGVCPSGLNGAPGCIGCHEITTGFCGSGVIVETCPSECTNGCNADGSCKQVAPACPSECTNGCNADGSCKQVAPSCPSECTNGCNADGSCKPEGNDCAAMGYEPCSEPMAEKCIDGKTHAVCIEGCWMTEDCSEKQLKCDSGKKQCVADCAAMGYEDCSEPDAEKCIDDKTHAVCIEGCWVTETCSAKAPKCDSGQKQCILDCSAAGYQACSAQENGQARCADDKILEVCQDGCWIPSDCSASGESCDADAKQCVASCAALGYQECSANENNTSKCLDDNTLGVCVDGCWMTDLCTDYGKVCKANQTGADCVTSKELGCNGNILITEDQGKIIELDCGSINGICDPAAKDCKPAEEFSCEGTVLTVKGDGKSYTFDCASENFGCHKDVGCSKDYCDGKARMRCENGVCAAIETCDGNCNEVIYNKIAETSCGCTKAQEDELRCVDSKAYAMCIDGQWVEEACAANEECQEGLCVPASLCGNGYINAGEDCDGEYFKEYGLTCNKYDKYSAFTGAPSCVNCRVSLDSCKVKPESEIISWKFTSLDVIKNYTKGDTCEIYGGFDTSKYSKQDGKDTWILGSWGKATTPDFENKFLEFDVADVTDYDSLSISFYVKRTNNGPKSLKLRYKAGSKTEYSEEITVPTKWNASPTQLKLKHDFIKAASGKLEIRFRGYAQSEETGGTMSISEVVVRGAKK
ncbi:MAG: hypothetical protein II180_11690 [Proteobacteria bacterium]|nr:hypothetical protein [Pseudomonadota bacterium]